MRTLDGREAADATLHTRFPSGVAAIARTDENGHDGMLVSSFSIGTSFDPPLVSFSASHGSSTWSRLRTASHLGVSILGLEHGARTRQLTDPDPRRRFDGIDVTATATGALLVDRAPLLLECRVFAEFPAGDHTVVLLEVEAFDEHPAAAPLVWHGSRFHTLSAIA
ncbi:Flavin-dependent monooxygenase, reductase subunit HsaB [Frondihabitans sp. 762G35]|uniref:flavin reductase family protein n=1 Tax=Frondihabitans sp. 762G35 TaxID=1446794 RepID=UPI000D21245C|nr:flavin reductase family protein [Frondihabitans sp. 762G35]ARC56067.1 Flavin-dependent monooxygenase, reductase subunit HsaB [Frondihabitans sp. 762G35]